ncbi:MAG: hypothetical protein GXO25_07500 [Euryarchaeota archaeon]|nr:hypothetical protein [Euryarchaeota archaeon]
MSIIIYPAYFNPHYSRKEGRRVPKSMAFEAKVETIARALRALGYDFEIEPDKRYPRFWWKEKGRLVVNTDERKNEVIKKIARKVRNI